MMIRNYFSKLLMILLIFFGLLIACQKENGDGENVDDNLNEDNYSLDFFYGGINVLELELAYETGAEPITESSGILGSNEPWNLTKNNIEALFSNRGNAVAIDVPLDLAEMKEIPKQQEGDYSAEVISEIASRYREGVNEDSSGNIFVLFVDAYYEAGGERRENVLGVAIKNTPYVAIFKPVINSISGSSAQKNAEQATVIHEVGHALGLVNFGVPLSSSHHDEEHGAHCTNEDCVMFWQVENKAELVSFIGLIQDHSTILFGQECLNDTRSYYP